jgi:plasmid stabilization system protein ParE
MSYPYVLLANAQEEYESAIAWYAARSIKAAENLITEIENTIQLICDNPNRWRNTYKQYQELYLRK